MTDDSPGVTCSTWLPLCFATVQVIPMLPRLLCEELCSLNPLTDRLTFSVIWKITPEGKVWQLKSGRKGLMADYLSRSCLQILFSMVVMVFVLMSPARPSRSWTSGSAAQSSAPAWSWVMTTLRAWSRPPKRCSLPRSCPPWTPSTPSMRSTRLCWTCTLLPRTCALSASQEERSDWTRWGSVTWDQHSPKLPVSHPVWLESLGWLLLTFFS